MFVIIPLIVSLTSCVVENPFYRDDKLIEEGIEDKSNSDKLNSPDTELESQIEDNNDNIESSSDSKEDKGNETKEQENDEETDNPASEQSEDIGDGENQDDSSDSKEGNEEEGDQQESHEHIHTLLTDEQAATCEKDGYIKTNCSDPNCDYYKEENFPALGHYKVKEPTSENVVQPGNHFERTKFCFSCSRCGEQFLDETFEQGVSNFAVTTGFRDLCEGDEEKTAELIRIFRTLEEKFYDSYYNDVFELSGDNKYYLRVKINLTGNIGRYVNKQIADYAKSFGNFASTLRKLFGDINPIVENTRIFNSNYSFYTDATGDTLICTFPLTNGSRTPQQRKSLEAGLFNSVFNKYDKYFRTGASDIEKAAILFNIVGDALLYDKTHSCSNLTQVIPNMKGDCNGMSSFFSLLANRYGLACFKCDDGEHCYNALNIDGIWYFVEPKGSYTSTDGWFLNENYRGTLRPKMSYMIETTGRMAYQNTDIPNPRTTLFYLYKNNKYLGVYSDVNKVLDDFVDDPEADYKISLGVDQLTFLEGVDNIKYYNCFMKTTWKVKNNENLKFKSLTFTTTFDPSKLNTNASVLQISQEMMNKNVIIDPKITYEVI